MAAGIAPDALMPARRQRRAETVDLTRHALSLGVTRVVMLPPSYYKGVSDDGLFAAYAAPSRRSATIGCAWFSITSRRSRAFRSPCPSSAA